MTSSSNTESRPSPHLVDSACVHARIGLCRRASICASVRSMALPHGRQASYRNITVEAADSGFIADWANEDQRRRAGNGS